MTVANEEFTDAALRDLLAAVRRQARLRAMSNDELADGLLAIWTETPLNGWRADVLDEAISRLRVWHEPAEEIQARVDSADEVEFTAEDHAALDRAFERVVATLEGASR